MLRVITRHCVMFATKLAGGCKKLAASIVMQILNNARVWVAWSTSQHKRRFHCGRPFILRCRGLPGEFISLLPESEAFSGNVAGCVCPSQCSVWKWKGYFLCPGLSGGAREVGANELRGYWPEMYERKQNVSPGCTRPWERASSARACVSQIPRPAQITLQMAGNEE